MRDIGYYQEAVQEMVAQDRGRDKMLVAMEKMWRGEWNLPRGIAELG